MSEVPIADLCRAAGEGSAVAWDELVGRHTRLVTWAARTVGLGPDDAADVTQETFRKLVEHLAGIRSPEAVATWLVTTARNESRRLMRQRRRYGASVEWCDGDRSSDVEVSGDPAADAILRRERSQLVRASMRRLLSPERYALLALLAEDPALTYEEAAQRLGMPRGSIGPTRGRSLATLRGCPVIQSLV